MGRTRSKDNRLRPPKNSEIPNNAQIGLNVPESPKTRSNPPRNDMKSRINAMNIDQVTNVHIACFPVWRLLKCIFKSHTFLIGPPRSIDLLWAFSNFISRLDWSSWSIRDTIFVAISGFFPRLIALSAMLFCAKSSRYVKCFSSNSCMVYIYCGLRNELYV